MLQLLSDTLAISSCLPRNNVKQSINRSFVVDIYYTRLDVSYTITRISGQSCYQCPTFFW